MSEFIPNFTQTPNIIFDELMSDLTDSELRVLMYICRRTYGFHRESDRIAYRQFEYGIDGLDKGCGLRSEAIGIALKSLEERGIIIKEPLGHSFKYGMNQDFGYRRIDESATDAKARRLPIQQKKEKEREIKIHSRVEYLMDIPQDDIDALNEKYEATRVAIIREGETAYHWVKSKGKTYVNYQSFLNNWLKRVFGYRKIIKPNTSTRL